MPSDTELLTVLTRDQLAELQAYCRARNPRRRSDLFYVPVSPGPDHPLTRLYGPDMAKTLGARHGGRRFTISRGLLIGRRNAHILSARRSGLPAADIARLFGIAARTVRHICHGEDVPRIRQQRSDDDRPESHERTEHPHQSADHHG